VTIYNSDWSSTVTWANSKQNEILYCGYRWDPESGLYQVRNRYYHLSLGNWMRRDPLGGLNLYQYGASSPSRYVDPYGLLEGSYGFEADGLGFKVTYFDKPGADGRCKGFKFSAKVEVFKTPKVRFAIGPVPAEFELEISGSVAAKGERCCIKCDDGSTGYTWSGSLSGKVSVTPSLMLGTRDEIKWAIPVFDIEILNIEYFLGARLYYTASLSSKAKIKYNTCRGRLSFGFAGTTSAKLGIEAGLKAKGDIVGLELGLEAMGDADATLKLEQQIECDSKVCSLDLGKINLSGRVGAHGKIIYKKHSLGFEHDFFEGDKDFGPIKNKTFDSPAILVRLLKATMSGK